MSKGLESDGPIISIKDKLSEKVIKTVHDAIPIVNIISLFPLKKGEHIIIEDECHNILKEPIVSPPRVVYVCIFTPGTRSKKRRNIMHEIIPNIYKPHLVKPTSKVRQNSILI
jgi:hypothetical protein